MSGNRELFGGQAIRSHDASASVALLQAIRPPALVPSFSARLTKFSPPFTENTLPQSNKVAVLCVVGVGEAPGESAANDLWFVRVWGDDAEGEKWILRSLTLNGYRPVSYTHLTLPTIYSV